MQPTYNNVADYCGAVFLRLMDAPSRPSAGQLSMIAIGGAIGTGLLLGSGCAIGFAGFAVLISYSIGCVIALLLMGRMAGMTIAPPT